MSDEPEQFHHDLVAEVSRRQRDADDLVAAYERDADRVRGAAVVEYRCKRRGCLLMHVWQAPAGLTYYQPPYKLSPRRNDAESNAAGRERNTVDGQRHWRARAGKLDDLRGWGPQAGLSLQCDHVRLTLPSTEVLAMADEATPGKPTRRTV